MKSATAMREEGGKKVFPNSCRQESLSEGKLCLVSGNKAEIENIERELLTCQDLSVPPLEGIANYFQKVRRDVNHYFQLNMEKGDMFIAQMLEMDPALLQDLFRFIGRDTRRKIAEYIKDNQFDVLEKNKLLSMFHGRLGNPQRRFFCFLN